MCNCTPPLGRAVGLVIKRQITDLLATEWLIAMEDLTYTLDNSIACCTMCNFMKGDLSVASFVSYVGHIAARFDRGDHSIRRNAYDCKELCQDASTAANFPLSQTWRNKHTVTRTPAAGHHQYIYHRGELCVRSSSL